MKGHSGAIAVPASFKACFILAALLFLGACSLPRIIVLNDPLSVEEHIRLGRIYETQGKNDLALQQYQEALRKDPDSVPSLLLLGDLSFRAKKYSDAEAAYRKAIKLQPGNGDVYNNLCWVYIEQNRFEKTGDLIKTAMAATPEHRAYYLDTNGVILLRTGKISESITTLQEAIELIPPDQAGYLAEAYAHLAEAYRKNGDDIHAAEAEKAAEQYRARQ